MCVHSYITDVCVHVSICLLLSVHLCTCTCTVMFVFSCSQELGYTLAPGDTPASVAYQQVCNSYLWLCIQYKDTVYSYHSCSFALTQHTFGARNNSHPLAFFLPVSAFCQSKSILIGQIFIFSRTAAYKISILVDQVLVLISGIALWLKSDSNVLYWVRIRNETFK